MKYNKGDTLMNDHLRRKILEVIGDLYFTSGSWASEYYAIENSQKVGTCYTEYELDENGWTLCPPDETLLPKEAWKPREGEKYWFAWIDSEGEANAGYIIWYKNSLDNKRLAIGNVHKTKEEAIAWAKKRYNIV
jgi:hypothetical protein